MSKIEKVQHIALIVENLEEGLVFWRDKLGLTLERVQEVPGEKARVAFFPLGEVDIELVQPLDKDSGLGRFLQKRGPGMHHLCLRVDDLEGMLEHLQMQGIQLLHPTPLVDENGTKYAFIHPKSAWGVLIELYELPRSLPERED